MLMKQTLIGFCMLLIAVLAICLFYNYPSILHLLPQGSHVWRQTYSMDMAINYKLYHLPFFQPEVSNLASINGRAAAEFPLFYYIAAQFNDSEFVLRIIHTGIFLTGIISAYYIAFYFLKDKLLSIYVMLFLFSSPLLVFYGNNFLSDVPALSIAYTAWAIYLHHSSSKYGLLLFFVLLACSCLLKASQAINYGILLYISITNTGTILRKKYCLLLFVITLIPVLYWYHYAKIYNLNNQHTYFFLGISPIWKLSWYDIGLTGWRIIISWSKNYFWRPFTILLILCSFLYWKYRKRIPQELSNYVISSFLLTAVYSILFYERFMNHEYYIVTVYIFVLYWIITLLYICKRYYGEIISWVKVFTGCLLLINIIYCKIFTKEKLTDTSYNSFLTTNGMQQFLTAHGVYQYKSVLSIPDDTPCQTLYLIKRKGYTEFNHYQEVLKDHKADFLVLNDEHWKQNNALQPYLKDSIGYYNGITLYKLK